MENFGINILSKRIKNNKRKIYEEINDADLMDLPTEKIKKIKKNKEEKLIQLFDDSDSLEEISPELNKKFKEEEENKLSTADYSIRVIGEGGCSIKRKRSVKNRNNSLVNISISNYKKTFFNEKENKSKEDLDDKKTYIGRKNILLYDPKIIEEDLKEEEDNNSADDNSLSKKGNTGYKLKKLLLEDSIDNLNNKNRKLRSSKSQDMKNTRKKSRLLDEIKNLSKTINVFLFDSDEYIQINIYPSNTVKEIKTRIIRELKSKKYNLTNTTTDAYDLRLIDEEGDSPDMDFPPLRDYVRVAGLKPIALAFLKNPDYTVKTTREKSFDLSWIYQKQQNLMFGSFKARNSRFSVVPEEDDEDGPEKYEVKIYYKDIKGENLVKSENIFLNPEDTLKNILEIFFKKNILKFKNVNLYYFVTHNSEEDLDNPYNLDINIKFLPPPYELDLCYKIFQDLPQALNTYQLSVNRKCIEERIKQL